MEATERQATIARLANEERARRKLPARDYTAEDVRFVFAAWQRDYRERKAAGRLKKVLGRNAWRRAGEAGGE